MALDSAIDIEFQLSVKNQQIFMNDIAIPKMLNNEKKLCHFDDIYKATIRYPRNCLIVGVMSIRLGDEIKEGAICFCSY